MHGTTQKTEQTDPFNPQNYAIKTFDDEIKVEKLCKVLLQQYHHYLLNNKDISPLQAGSHAGGADYFLRDFMIDNRRINIIAISPELIHSFAGNWYIISTLEPNMEELGNILGGIDLFYDFCAEKNMLDPSLAEEIHQACSRTEYYRERIESFHAISGDGYIDWNSSCSLK
jgi:hypothetical protein